MGLLWFGPRQLAVGKVSTKEMEKVVSFFQPTNPSPGGLVCVASSRACITPWCVNFTVVSDDYSSRPCVRFIIPTVLANLSLEEESSMLMKFCT